MLKGVDAFGPVVRVSNLDEAVDFFEKIGFQCNFKWGEPPHYAVMSLTHNDTYTMHLYKHDNVAQDGVGLYFITEDVDEVYAKALELGLTILHELADQPYGMRDFSVEGPDKIPVAVGREVR
jgi:uncharacterized glyoxalase superfamily protein PhnB